MIRDIASQGQTIQTMWEVASILDIGSMGVQEHERSSFALVYARDPAITLDSHLLPTLFPVSTSSMQVKDMGFTGLVV